MIDLFDLSGLDKPLLKLKNIIYLFYKTRHLNEEVNCTEPFPLISVPWREKKVLKD